MLIFFFKWQVDTCLRTLAIIVTHNLREKIGALSFAVDRGVCVGLFEVCKHEIWPDTLTQTRFETHRNHERIPCMDPVSRHNRTIIRQILRKIPLLKQRSNGRYNFICTLRNMEKSNKQRKNWWYARSQNLSSKEKKCLSMFRTYAELLL